MTHSDTSFRYHEDADLFSGALTFTESLTGFTAHLIEKDYYCSVLLDELADFPESSLVFRGGTCLSKVHTDFYRMSEDLDFIISTEVDSSRSDRRKKIAPWKEYMEEVPEKAPCFTVSQSLKGFNNSTQYSGLYSYQSLVTGQVEHIKVEIGLREPVLHPAEYQQARTILLDPFKREPAIEPFRLRVLSGLEAYAEKFRAALTRREPAIRDFYDIDYGLRKTGMDPFESDLLKLIQKKLVVPGNEPIDISEERLNALRMQLEPQLKPVLRAQDYADFDLERIFRSILQLAEVLISD